MKKVILGICSVFILFSCHKNETILNSNDNNTNEEIYDVKAAAPKKGVIACTVYANGVAVGTGTRCGTPTGTCGKKYTACQIINVRSNMQLPNDMTVDEFIDTWNNDETRHTLEELGFYEEDNRD
jgi:hypothetical protein